MKDHLTGQLFIRDDIPVRQLDKRYKRRMLQLAGATAWWIVGGRWQDRFLRWKMIEAVKPVLLKGA